MPTVLYLPAATLLFEWFLTRRGLATGIMFSGQSLAFRRSGVVSQAQSDQFWFSIRYRSRRVRVPVRHEGAHREIWVQGGDVLRGQSGPPPHILSGR
jgi:hypothetical protein